VGFSLTYLPLIFLVLGALVWGARGATLATFVLAAIAGGLGALITKTSPVL
jgi:hypothetical protein